MSNLVARRTFYGRPCPNHDLSWLCVVGDARSTAVAALTWVLWKGRNRLQNLEATSQIFYGPDSVPNILNFGFFLEKGSFKTALYPSGLQLMMKNLCLPTSSHFPISVSYFLLEFSTNASLWMLKKSQNLILEFPFTKFLLYCNLNITFSQATTNEFC